MLYLHLLSSVAYPSGARTIGRWCYLYACVLNSSNLDITCAVVDSSFAAIKLFGYGTSYVHKYGQESVSLWFFITACCLLSII